MNMQIFQGLSPSTNKSRCSRSAPLVARQDEAWPAPEWAPDRWAGITRDYGPGDGTPKPKSTGARRSNGTPTSHARSSTAAHPLASSSHAALVRNAAPNDVITSRPRPVVAIGVLRETYHAEKQTKA